MWKTALHFAYIVKYGKDDVEKVQLICWRVKLMFLIHIFKKYVITHLVDRRFVLLGPYLKFCVFGTGSFISPIAFFSYLRLMK